MERKIDVDATLTLELSGALGKIWLERVGGGMVVLELSEINGLVEALSEAAARLAAEIAGETYEDNLF